MAPLLVATACRPGNCIGSIGSGGQGRCMTRLSGLDHGLLSDVGQVHESAEVGVELLHLDATTEDCPG